jgi:hypothetical protein
MNNPTKTPALPAANKKIHVYFSFRYVAKSFCYVAEGFRYVAKSFRYVAESFRYAAKSFCYVAESFRYAAKSFCYVAESFRYVAQTKIHVTFFVCRVPLYQSIPPQKCATARTTHIIHHLLIFKMNNHE